MPLAAGTRLGPYEVLAPIGSGGMGEVYRGRDSRLDRSVAIKILPAEFAGDAQFKVRFEREAKTISSLNDPHICQLYDVGQIDGTDYLVMEFLDGVTLAERLEKGPLPLPQALKVGVEIASALDKAHRQGIVHRDLKPSNIMLTKSGAKLLDFGLAKPQEMGVVAGLTRAATEHKAQLTQEGMIVGTFQYMAPEQLEGLEADARTDLWALGAVLYEMVTARKAFEGKTKTSLIAAIIDREPEPVSHIQPLTPPAVDHVIRKCLAKDPDDRWQNAHDVAEELRWIAQVGSGAGVATVVAHRRLKLEKLTLLAVFLLVIALGIMTYFWIGERTRAQPLLWTAISPPPGMALNFGEIDAGSLSLSPDGKRITFIAPGDDGRLRIWIRSLDQPEPRPLAGTEDATYPFWSPDSQHLAFFADRKLRRIAVDGGAVLDLAKVTDARGGTWGRDDVILYTPYWREALYRIPAGGGSPVPETKLDPGRRETTHRWPLFLPDGRHYFFLAGSHTAETTSGDNALYLASLDEPKPRFLLHTRSNVDYARGFLFYLRGQDLVAQKLDAGEWKLVGEPKVIARGVRYEKGFFQGVFAVSDDVIVFQSGPSETRRRLVWSTRDGTEIGTVGEPAGFFDLALSPDGNLLAAATSDPADIWVYDFLRGVRNRFTLHPMSEGSPVWSPDQKTLLYWTDRRPQFDVYAKPIHGGPEVAFLATAEVSEVPLDWSADGRFILFAREDLRSSTKTDLWVKPLQGDSYPLIATPADELEGQFSPDGRWLAYTSDESGRLELYVTPFPSSTEKWQISEKGGSAPRWRSDGRELFYIGLDGKAMSVSITSVAPFVISSPQPLFAVDLQRQGPVQFWDAAPDGKRFIVSRRLEADLREPITVITNWHRLLER